MSPTSDEREPNVEAPMMFGGRKPRWCMSCAYADGEPPWADSPLKSYCVMYARGDGRQKPPEVYYDGAECEFYRRA